MTAAAPATADTVVKQTYRVAVTSPDETGRPVELDTDVYLPTTAPRAGGYPMVEVFHGGGSRKDNSFDAGYARSFAEQGYVSVIYSQRGHGNSGGQATVAGPPEVRDLFDVTAWMLGGSGLAPAHPDFRVDRSRIALQGFSQGGLNTNLAQVYAGDPSFNPYGVHFVALVPGNTPDVVFNALVPHDVVKLSFVAGLVATYSPQSGVTPAPNLVKTLAALAADQPALYGGGLCDTTGHDTPTGGVRADLAQRSVGCFAERVTPPVFWAQAMDDGLFPPEMAISMFHRLRNPDNRLYLDTGGHGAPGEPKAFADDRLRAQLAFLDHVFNGAPFTLPRVTYYTRDPRVAVPANDYRYPTGAWYRQTADAWPPAGTTRAIYHLRGDGRAVRGPAGAAGTAPLAPITADEATDPVLAAGLSATPLGTSATGLIATPPLPGLVASFVTDPLPADTEMSGAPFADLAWTPASPDTQLVLKLFDQAPDGMLTLVGRGVEGLRGRSPGGSLSVRVQASDFSVLLHAGHRLLAVVTAGDVAFYKPFPGSLGGTLRTGAASTLTLPLRAQVRMGPGGNSGGTGRRSVRRAPGLRLRVRPRAVRRGQLVVLRFSATVRTGGHTRPVPAAIVRFVGRRARTNARGRASFAVRMRRIGSYRARATRRGLRPGVARVRVHA